MTKMNLIDCIGNCNEHGEPSGHVLKTTSEAIGMLQESLDLKLAITKDYQRYFDEELIECVFDYSSKEMYSSKIIDKFKYRLKILRAVAKTISNGKNMWFINTDIFVYLGILLSRVDKSKRIFVTNYIDYKANDGFRSVIKHAIYVFATKKVTAEFTTNPNATGKKKFFFPDYVYDEVYSHYTDLSKENKVSMYGGINEGKDVRGLISTFGFNKQRLEIKGSFSSNINFNEIKKCVCENITIQNTFLSSDDYYSGIATSKFVVIPYKNEYYNNRSSGVILEAIFLGSTVIAPKFLLNYLGLYGVGYEEISELNDFRISDFSESELENMRRRNMDVIKKYNKKDIYSKYLSLIEANCNGEN